MLVTLLQSRLVMGHAGHVIRLNVCSRAQLSNPFLPPHKPLRCLAPPRHTPCAAAAHHLPHPTLACLLVCLLFCLPACLQTSIWYGCVLRGDLNRIKVGAFTNVQDRTVIHAAR